MIRITAPKNRAVSLASTAGITIRLAPGETRTAQPMFAQAAAVAGCAIAHGVEQEPPAVLSEDTRIKALLEAVEGVVEKGNPDDFTTGGRPRKAAVQMLVDFDFTAAELTAAFESMNS